MGTEAAAGSGAGTDGQRRAQPRQLGMLLPSLEGLPALEVPPGYGLRTWRDGDERAWGAIMESPDGIGTNWTVQAVREKLVSRPQFQPDSVFFATFDTDGDAPVASAASWRHPEEERSRGYVHMVASLPAHRGKGLGRLVTLATLHHMRRHGFKDARLETDDFREAAVRTYLRLGFVPQYVDDPLSDHQARWSAVLRRVMDRR